jgi:hypothetical protein
MAERLDHKLLEDFLGSVLDRYKAGTLSRASAIGIVDHLFAALEIPNWGSNPTNYMKKVLASEGGGK